MIGPFAGSERSKGLRREALVSVDSVKADVVEQWVRSWVAEVAAALGQDTTLAGPLQGDCSREAFFLADRWAFRLRSRIWCEQYREIVIEHPADWWQAVRERFAPSWWLRRFPVRKVEHRITPAIIYPNLAVSMPHESHVLDLRHDSRATPADPEW